MRWRGDVGPLPVHGVVADPCRASASLRTHQRYPTLISPLFNTFKPLEEGATRVAIEQLVGQSGLSCEKIFEVDGSKQSAHSNACAPPPCLSPPRELPSLSSSRPARLSQPSTPHA